MVLSICSVNMAEISSDNLEAPFGYGSYNVKKLVTKSNHRKTQEATFSIQNLGHQEVCLLFVMNI